MCLPVAFDLLAAFLDVSEAAAGVTFLLVGVVTVPGHVSSLPTVVAELLPLLLWLLTVSGDVTSSATVITGCRDERTHSHSTKQLQENSTECSAYSCNF